MWGWIEKSVPRISIWHCFACNPSQGSLFDITSLAEWWQTVVLIEGLIFLSFNKLLEVPECTELRHYRTIDNDGTWRQCAWVSIQSMYSLAKITCQIRIFYYIPAKKYSWYNHLSDSKIQNLVSPYSGDIFPYHHPPCFNHLTSIKPSTWWRTAIWALIRLKYPKR